MKLMRDGLSLSKEGKEEAEWIDVCEKLPTINEHGLKVLLWRKTNTSQALLSVSIYDTLMVKYCEDGTKWMPLPKLPTPKTEK